MVDKRAERPDLGRAVRGYYDSLDRDDIESVLEFFSGDDCFATAAYTIDASTPEGAEHHALSMSLDCIYNDPRIPDLSRAATARPMDDPDAPI